MEGRMTVCNMAIEAGARRPRRRGRHDDQLREGLPPFTPMGVEWGPGRGLLAHAAPDEGARFDKLVELDAAQILPQVTWGTSPEMVLSVADRVPDPDKEKDAVKRGAIERALTYMALEPNKAISDIHVDKIFIGSCTNSRIEDMREAAAVVKRMAGSSGPHRQNIKLALVVPGSGLVKAQAEAEGLTRSSRPPASSGASPVARCAWR